MIDWDGLISQARLFLLIFARVVAMVRTAPVVSSKAVPGTVRGALSFFVSLSFFSLVGNLYGPIPFTNLDYGVALVAEVLLGVIMGLFLQLIFAIFQTAGQLFSVQMGFGASQVFDPLAQVEIPLIGQFLNLVGMAVFLSVGGLSSLFFRGLAGSFRVMKGTDFLAADSFLKEAFLGALGGLFEQALVLAFPILGTLVLISVTMGLLAKAAPQMNLLMVGFPIQIGVGFLIMMSATPFLVEKMSVLVESGFQMIEAYFQATAEALG